MKQLVIASVHCLMGLNGAMTSRCRIATFGRVLLVVMSLRLLLPSCVGDTHRFDRSGTDALVVLQIQLADSALAKLRDEPRSYVIGLVSERSQAFTKVGIRLKGHSGFRSIDKKPSLTLKFNQLAPGQ
jgi:hypothetical protein